MFAERPFPEEIEELYGLCNNVTAQIGAFGLNTHDITHPSNSGYVFNIVMTYHYRKQLAYAAFDPLGKKNSAPSLHLVDRVDGRDRKR